MDAKYLFIIFITFLLSSCEFAPKGEFYPEVKEPTEPPNISIELNLATDTIIVEYYDNLVFKFQSDDEEIHWVKLYIDNTSCGTYEQNSGTFSITAHDCGNSIGTHEMRLEAFTSSGSGSIADAFGLEGFLFSKTWVLIMKEHWDYHLKVNSIKPDNGSLKISWEKFNGFDFKEYIIYKSLYDGSGDDTLAVIKDQHTTSIYDTAYVGEKVYYKVDVNTTDDREYRGEGMEYEDTIPQVFVGPTNNNRFTLVWNRSKFVRNIAYYEIYEWNSYTSNYKKIAQVDNPTDTLCVLDNLAFAVKHNLYLILIPKKMPSYLSGFGDKRLFLGTETEGFVGNEFYGYSVFTPIGDFMYYKTYSAIYEFNYKTEEITDCLKATDGSIDSYSVSPNRKFITAVTSSNNYILYNVETKDKKTYSANDLIGYEYARYNHSVSDIGIGVFEKPENGLLVYDFINEKVVMDIKPGVYIGNMNISPNGKYFIANRGRYSIYEVQNDTIVQIWDEVDYNINSNYLDFLPSNSERIVLHYDNQLYVKDLNDFSNISVSNIECPAVYHIDYNSNKILGATDEFFYVFDFNNGQKLWEYPALMHAHSPDNFSFCYNTIYMESSWDGHKLKIN